MLLKFYVLTQFICLYIIAGTRTNSQITDVSLYIHNHPTNTPIVEHQIKKKKIAKEADLKSNVSSFKKSCGILYNVSFKNKYRNNN